MVSSLCPGSAGSIPDLQGGRSELQRRKATVRGPIWDKLDNNQFGHATAMAWKSAYPGLGYGLSEDRSRVGLACSRHGSALTRAMWPQERDLDSDRGEVGEHVLKGFKMRNLAYTPTPPGQCTVGQLRDT